MSEEMGGMFDAPEEPIVPAKAPVPVPQPEEKKGTEEEKKGQLTTEPDRKLAFIVKIEKLEPIKGAENVEVATVLGWTVVVKKGEYKVGDLCIYFTIGAYPDPTNPAFDFLKIKGKMKELKSKKIKGVLSQGAIVPMSTLAYYKVDPATLKIGDDVTRQIKAMKGISEEEADVYAKDLPEQEPFPDFVPQTDEERIQNIPDILNEVAGMKVVVTRKEDGSSATFAFNKGRFYPCSRNNVWNKRTKASGQVYAIAEKYKLKEGMTRLAKNIAIQGEMVGPGLLNNRIALKDKEFRVFNIWEIDEKRYLGHDEILDVCKALNLETVPVLYRGVFPADWKTVEDLLKYAETIEYGPGMPGEGMVIKNDLDKTAKRISFKAVSNKYLTLYHT